MYFWIGIDVNNQLLGIRNKAEKIGINIGLNNSNFKLPFHISIKNPFYINQALYNNILEDLINIFNNITSFYISIKKIENNNNICWILMNESEKLNLFHDKVNELLFSKYNIPLHEYDKDYKFHVTLYMDGDKKKVSKAYELVKELSLPNDLEIREILIGTSESGELGTYKINKKYVLKK